MRDGRLVDGVATSEEDQRASRRLLRPRAAATHKRHERFDRTRSDDGHAVVGLESEAAQLPSRIFLCRRAAAAG